MRSLLVSGVVLFALSSVSFAQTVENAFDCQDTGNDTPEASGVDGQFILTENFACRVTAGPMTGANMTGTVIWNFNKNEGTLVSGMGVLRKPGSIVVYRDLNGGLTLTTNDKGEVTGASGAGKATWLIATGAAVSNQGKTWDWMAKTSGPGRFTVTEQAE